MGWIWGIKRDLKKLGRDLRQLKEEPLKMPLSTLSQHILTPQTRILAPVKVDRQLEVGEFRGGLKRGGSCARGVWARARVWGPQWAAFSSIQALSGLGPAVYFGCALDLSSATSRTDGWPLLCCVHQQLFRYGRVEEGEDCEMVRYEGAAVDLEPEQP